MIAALLSALGIFLRAPLVGLPIGTITGPSILLPALAAAVIARMTSLPIAFGAGIALGVVDIATFFSTGNHPVEMLLPMYHLDKAGFAFDIATISGEPAKLELWAYPKDDEAVATIYEKYKKQLKSPLKLADVVADSLGADSPYVAVFIPGGHGALNGVPFSTDVKKALDWALRADKHIISLCHGPAALLSAKLGEEENPFKGYKICSFPDTIDAKTPEMGYMPGAMPWFIGERLRADGLEIVNTDIKGTVHQDRKLITGDSPFASPKAMSSQLASRMACRSSHTQCAAPISAATLRSEEA